MSSPRPRCKRCNRFTDAVTRSKLRPREVICFECYEAENA